MNKVLRRTDARKVVIVGHSQGGMMPRQYMRFEGGRTKVRSLVGIAPSNHGTQGLITPAPDGTTPPPSGDSCRACDQQQAGSRFLKRLNRDGDLVHAPTVVGTGPSTPSSRPATTRWSRPTAASSWPGPPAGSPTSSSRTSAPPTPIEHDQAPNDPVVHQLVLEALSHHRAPADPTPQIDCTGRALN